MGSTLRAAGLALVLAAAPLPMAGTAAAMTEPPAMTQMVEETAGFAVQTLGWCLRGATFTVVLSSAFALPALATGMGAPIGAAEITAAAGVGCGFGVFWGTAFSTAGWVVDQFSGPTIIVPPGPGATIRF